MFFQDLAFVSYEKDLYLEKKANTGENGSYKTVSSVYYLPAKHKRYPPHIFKVF